MSLDLPEPLGRPRRAEYTPRDFISFRESHAFEISPKFQRRSVWKTAQRSYFLDTMIRGLPVPPIYLRESQNEQFSAMVRQVIDGQQRIRTVLDYMDGKFAISRSLPSPWAGLNFSDLTEDAQSRISNYHFACEVFTDIPDQDVLNIFARMNTYSVQLNKQELRNGKWFGFFKTHCYELGSDHLGFWRTEKIFTEAGIARMLEIELASELVIAGLAGLQDKKKSIDKFYAENDEKFVDGPESSLRFRSVIDEISETSGGNLGDTEFRRVPLFYSLYCAVYHRLYGLPGLNLKRIRNGRMRQEERDDLNEAIGKLSDLVRAAREGDPTPELYQGFVQACLSQTDNIQPRNRRVETLLREARLV